MPSEPTHADKWLVALARTLVCQGLINVTLASLWQPLIKKNIFRPLGETWWAEAEPTGDSGGNSTPVKENRLALVGPWPMLPTSTYMDNQLGLAADAWLEYQG